MFTLVLLDGILDGFSIPIITSRKLHFKKAFLVTLRKLLHGLAEHIYTRKCKKSNILAESNTIFKNIVLQDLGTIRIRFLQNSTKQNVMFVYLLILPM
jgi:hypothetical protein